MTTPEKKSSEPSAVESLSRLVHEAVRISDLAREELRLSELRYRRIFETAQDGILLINAETAEVEDVNPFLLRLLNYTHDEFLDMKLWEIGAFKDITQSKDMFKEIQTSGYVRYEDLPLETKAGDKIAVEFVSNLYDVEGRKVIQCNIRDISDRKAAENNKLLFHEQLKQALHNTVQVATIISELRDPYTAGHERRVATIACAIGAELGFDEIRKEGLRVAGALHDIGKVDIPSEILAKPGKLSAIEYQLIQAHAQASYDVLNTMAWPWPVAEIALQHHERIDGSGYPQGLKGDAILLEARILAVADVVEAMSSHRPYRAALGLEKALAEIELGRGKIFDAQVVDACLNLFRNKAFTLPL